MLYTSQPTIPYEVNQPVASLGSGLAQALNNEGYQGISTNLLVNSNQNCPLPISKDTASRPEIIQLAVKEWFDLMLLYIKSQEDCGVLSSQVAGKI